MATKMLTKGEVQFNGVMIELGKPVMVNGRKGTPFLAWLRDGVSPDGIKGVPNTTVRFKWERHYMPSDLCDVHWQKATIAAVPEIEAAA